MTTRVLGGMYPPRPGNNIYISHMEPAPGDLFCCVTVGGKLVLTRTIDRHYEVLKWLDVFACTQPPHEETVVIKVFCLTLKEAQAMDFVPTDLFQHQTPEQDAADRQLVVNTLKQVLVGQDVGSWGSGVHGVKVRTEALKLLQELGELR